MPAQPQEKPTRARDFLAQRVIQINLTVLTLFWLSCALNHTVLTFQLKYFPGNIYLNSIISASSDIIGYSISGVLVAHIGNIRTWRFGFGATVFGGVLMLGFLHATDYYNTKPGSLGNLTMLYGLFILIAKLGICTSFNVIYCSFSEMFPPLFSVTAFAISNFLARCSSFFGPQIAEVHSTLPVLIMTGLSLASFVACSFINHK